MNEYLRPRHFLNQREVRLSIYHDAWARTNFLFEGLTHPKRIDRVVVHSGEGINPAVVSVARFDWIERADATIKRIDARLMELRRR